MEASRTNWLELTFLLSCLSLVTSDLGNIQTLYADQGSNVTLQCLRDQNSHHSVQWAWGPASSGDGRQGARKRIQPQTNGDLAIFDVHPEDDNIYLCQDAESNESLHKIFLKVSQRVTDGLLY